MKNLLAMFEFGTRLCAIPLGELTQPACRGGATSIARKTVTRARGACPHTWTGALRSGAPPDGEQTDLLADESAPSAAAARGLHKNRHAHDGRAAAALYALCSGQPTKRAWQ
jgi:hypothetical protein